MEAGSLLKHWRQFKHANQLSNADLESLSAAARPLLRPIEEARARATRAITDHGVARLLAPWRGEPVEAWLLRMLGIFDDLRQAAYSCVVKAPDRARLDRLPDVLAELNLAALHVENILVLRESGAPAQEGASKQPPQDEAEIDDGVNNLFPDEIDVDERYQHVHWNLADPGAREVANLIMDALRNVMEIGRNWAPQYALEALVGRGKQSASEKHEEVFGTIAKAWIDYQGKQGTIQKCIEAGNARRAGEAWAKDLLDALDSVQTEFNAHPIDPTKSDEAMRAGMVEELARGKQFVKFADRLYDAYRNLAYAYIVPQATGAEAEPTREDDSRPSEPPATATTTAKRGRLMVNERMEATLIKNPEARGWTITRWCAELGCSRPAIQKTKMWKALHAQHVVEKANAELSKSAPKRRKRRPR